MCIMFQSITVLLINPKKTKDINVKTFNMISNKIKAKTMTTHLSCNCQCKFNSSTYNSNEKWNHKTCQCKCKNYCIYEKDYNWSPSIRTCDNSKYLKSIADTSMIACDEIISVMDFVSTKMTNTIATNASIICYREKVRYKTDYYILHTALLVIILLLIITIIHNHYAKNRSTQKAVMQ